MYLQINCAHLEVIEMERRQRFCWHLLIGLVYIRMEFLRLGIYYSNKQWLLQEIHDHLYSSCTKMVCILTISWDLSVLGEVNELQECYTCNFISFIRRLYSCHCNNYAKSSGICVGCKLSPVYHFVFSIISSIQDKMVIGNSQNRFTKGKLCLTNLVGYLLG